MGEGWVGGESLLRIEEGWEKGSIIMCLLWDGGVICVWGSMKGCVSGGKGV